MGAFSTIQPIVIKGRPGWEPHEEILLKGRVTAGDMDIVLAAERSGRQATAVLETMIVQWTLCDPSGRAMPVNAQTVAALPMEYANPLLDEITKITQGMPKQEAAAFLPDAPVPSSVS